MLAPKPHLLRLFIFLLLSSLVLAACEDDPIVGPAGEEPSGGSYGKIQLLPADTLRVPVDTSAVLLQRPPNPERF